MQSKSFLNGIKKIFPLSFQIIFVFAFLLLPQISKADVLSPGNISTCGELAEFGAVYTLTSNVTAVGTSSCFIVSADNITISGGNGSGYTINGTGEVAIDTRARTGNTATTTGTLTEGADGYTNLVINNVNISGFTNGVNLSGNDNANGYGGKGGDIFAIYTTTGSITSNGGNSNLQYGGDAGIISLEDIDLNISNNTMLALGGLGTVGRGSNGVLDLNYSGTLTKTNLTLSALLSLNDNATEYPIYPGGTWPITPGDISTCGTLMGPGTFTLTQNLISSSTCFYIYSNGVTVDGAGYTITSATTTNTSPAILVGNYSSFTLASTTLTDFSSIIISPSSVTISGNNLNFENKTLSATSLSILGGILNLSSTTINAENLNINYTTSVSGTTTAMTSALSSLIINSINYGTKTAGLIFSGDWKASESSRNWYSITSSSDGTKLAAVVTGGQIYTSTDSGVSWTARDSSRDWRSITSSSDGTKLAAVAYGGQIYTSTDSGVTWTPRESSRNWYSITSSSDGTKLAATVSGGQIYTSTDSGVTWAARASGSRSWNSITSSSDGTKLAATVSGGQIYTSTDSGVSWTPRESDRAWRSITSSSDGTKLASVVSGGYIYTSTTSGATWATSTGSVALGTKSWYSITSSSDGTKLAAVVYGGQIYTSTTSGATWVARASGSRNWTSITSSSDGTKLAAVVYGGQIYTFTDPLPTLSVDILRPSASSTISTWSPYVSWGISTSCYYSYDNFSSTSTGTCSSNGSDIPAPPLGTSTLSVRGVDTTGNTVTKSVTFNYTNQDNILINSPSNVSIYSAPSWLSSITYSISNQTLSACYYSYNNFTSTSTANCSLNGSDILPPTTEGNSTLSIKTINVNSAISTSNITFSYQFSWTPRESNRGWQFITSSSDGTKLAATVSGGQIYTSTDSGVTWVARASGSRSWYSITSSSDGTKLAAVVGGGYIYTSTTSGATWATSTGSVALGTKSWYSITSSSDGTKLAAVVYGGQIYTSTTSGATWVARASGSRNWSSITSSADGTNLAAVVGNGQIYTSTDSGVTWVARASGSRGWTSITSSSDGTKLASVVSGGYIYTSTTSGATWATSTGSVALGTKNWYSITSSSDGTKLAAVVYGGQIYTSTDSGVSWTPRESDRYWYSITSSSDGTKFTAVERSGQIYTLNTSALDDPYISINTPVSDGSITSWSPAVFWGFRKVLCQYSYDNFVTTNTVNCASGGSDILPPSSDGSNTLTIRAVNTNAETLITSSTFTYSLSLVNIFNHTNQVSLFMNLTSITSSSDGTKLAVVVYGGQIYTSTTSGATWVARASGSRNWTSITSSSDGTKLAATVFGGQIYTSTDSGVSWTPRESDRSWQSITSSSDGTKLASVVSSGYIYTSTTSGATWATSTGSVALGTKSWYSITSSSDGTKLAATVSGGQIYTSTNSGVSWTARDSSRSWFSITSSSDGTKLAAVVYGGYIYTSTTSGATWATSTGSVALGTKGWASITSSSDGTKLAAVESGGQIYTSTNSGVSWTARDSSRNWHSITSSSDGTKLAADVVGGQIYTSTDPLPTLSVDILRPSASSTVSSWSPYVSWGISTSCYYSYNNFSSTSTANCANAGSDISAPPPGTSTLSVKGIDANGNIDMASVTFSLIPYYWCGTADSNWNNANNWYTTNSCSVNIGNVPDSTNSAVLVGSVSPIVSTTTVSLPLSIDSTGLTGGAGTAGVIFANNTGNTANITGNATFLGASYNLGTITGNAIFNTGVSGVFTLSDSMKWGGSISGTIKGGDSTPITSLIFNNSSSNETTIPDTITTVFNNSASNNGTINGDTTFNGTTFRMGTVNGTVTANGLAQTIYGVNSVINFFKQLVGSESRDVVYLTSGSTLNVSGQFTFLGADSNNLLTVRSTIPNLFANLGINGTPNFDFLRIKDIYNTGVLLNLASKTVFDDGGNTGFTFPANSTQGSRGGITREYTVPILPVSRGGTLPTTPSTNSDPSSNAGSRTFVPNTINQITVPVQNLKPIKLTPLPTFGEDKKGAFSFKLPLQIFLFTNNGSSVINSLKAYPKLQKYITDTLHFDTDQKLVALYNKPLKLNESANNIEGIYKVTSSKGNTLTTTLKIDKKGNLSQYIKVSEKDNYETLKISLLVTSKTTITGKLSSVPSATDPSVIPVKTGIQSVNEKSGIRSENYSFTSNPKNITTTLNIPKKIGTYTFITSASPLPLTIEVASSQTNTPNITSDTSKGLWSRIKSFFGW